MSRALRDMVGPGTVADTSAGMRKVMEWKVAGGIADWRSEILIWRSPRVPSREERVRCHRLGRDAAPLPAAGAGVVKLRTLLPEGGQLAIVDLDEEDGTFTKTGFDRGTHGARGRSPRRHAPRG